MKKLLLIIFIGLTSCNNQSKKVEYSFEEQKTHDSLVEIEMEKFRTEVQKDKVTGWNYEEEKNPMTDSKNIYYHVQSKESLKLKFPYEGVNFGRLTVRRVDGSTDILISIKKGQITGDYENKYFNARFDDGKQTKFSYLGTADGSSETIFVRNTAKFLKMLKASQKSIDRNTFISKW